MSVNIGVNVNVHTSDQKFKPMNACTRLQAGACLGVVWVHWGALLVPRSRRNHTRGKTVVHHLKKTNQGKLPRKLREWPLHFFTK